MLKNIVDKVVDAIKKQECLDLIAHMFCIYKTCAKLILTYIDYFIISPQFAALNKKYSDYTLHALHLSLNIKDQVAAFIQKQKLLIYSQESSLADK